MGIVALISSLSETLHPMLIVGGLFLLYMLRAATTLPLSPRRRTGTFHTTCYRTHTRFPHTRAQHDGTTTYRLRLPILYHILLATLLGRGGCATNLAYRTDVRGVSTWIWRTSPGITFRGTALPHSMSTLP